MFWKLALLFCVAMTHTTSMLVAVCLLLLVLSPSILAADCSDEDLKYIYTPCAEGQPTRTLIWYSEKDCDVPASKAPVHNIACDLQCEEGSYLQPGSTECKRCSQGEFSLGGGVMWGKGSTRPWDSISSLSDLAEFSTSCDPPGRCSTWRIEDGVLSSGNNTDFEDPWYGHLRVDLKYQVNLVRDGYISFEYRVDSEPSYDGLYFSVDGINKLELDYGNVMKQFRVDLKKGPHSLAWTYVKDRGVSVGTDRAYLYTISVSGTDYFDEGCWSCMEGTHSEKNEGSTKCVLCEAGTFHNGDTPVAQCTACADDKYSFPGFVECLAKVPCTDSDYRKIYGKDCKNGQRTVSYELLQPVICDESDPKADESIPCPECDPGTYPDGDTCKYCEPGYFSDGKGECMACAENQVAIKTLIYDHGFDVLKDGMQTGCGAGFQACDDDAPTKGWRLQGEVMDTNVGLSPNALVWLSLDVELSHAGAVSFSYTSYSLGTKDDTFGYLSFYVDDSYRYVPYVWDARGNFTREPSYDLTAGNHTLKWTYTTNGHTSSKPGLTMDYIRITAVTTGGAANCTSCPAGTVVKDDQSSCVSCPVGTYEEEGACKTCPVNTFTTAPGATKCLPCPAGTTSSGNSTKCDFEPQRIVVDNPSAQSVNSTEAKWSFDIEPLCNINSTADPDVVSERSSGFGYYYYFNLCGEVQESNCESLHAAGCQLWQGYGTMMFPQAIGRRVGFHSYVGSSNDTYGLLAVVEGGDVCEGSGADRNTTIKLICDGTANPGQVTVPSGDGKEEPKICQYEFIWRTVHACRLCDDEDWTEIKSECKDVVGMGQATVDYLPRENRTYCRGDSPTPRVVSCELAEGGGTPVWVAPVAALGTIVIVVLGVVLLVLYRRNRSLYSVYQRYLREENNMNAMGTFAEAGSKGDNLLDNDAERS